MDKEITEPFNAFIMKRLYLMILISVMILQQSHSQDYVPFPMQNAIWNTLFYGQTSPTNIYTINYQYKLMGDTVLNGTLYSKVYFTETNNKNPDEIYIGGLREDDMKQIFFFPVSQTLPTVAWHAFPNDTSEHMIYTFNNLEVGQILPVNADDKVIQVVSVDSVLIGDTYRKRYGIQNEGILALDYWIEGIGSTVEFLSAFTFEFEWSFYTLCFKIEEDTYYINSPDGDNYCHYMVGVDPVDIPNFRIYPNPTTGPLNIYSPFGGKTVVRVVNLQGQTILSSVVNDEVNQIDVDNLRPGLYFVQLQSGKLTGNFTFVRQ